MPKDEIRIFVGSPGDVQAEREQVFALLDELNKDPGIEPHYHIKGIGRDRTPYANNT